MNAQTKLEADTSVYAKIAAVQAELARTGIAKSRKNQQQGYQFRGIDEVYAALAPLLATHRLSILPRMLAREVVERQSQKGGALFNVTVEAEFDFVSADDGSMHTIRTFGEAMDSADKATNKAMSAAYKYAALMAFAIPTEGDNDADAMTHEVAARGQSQGSAVSPAATNEMPDDEWAKIAALIQATNADTTAMLKFYKVANLRQLNQEQYAHAVNSLNEKLAKMAKAETDAKAQAPNLAEELADEIQF